VRKDHNKDNNFNLLQVPSGQAKESDGLCLPPSEHDGLVKKRTVMSSRRGMNRHTYKFSLKSSEENLLPAKLGTSGFVYPELLNFSRAVDEFGTFQFCKLELPSLHKAE
jgi:hypothetical protein